MIEKTWLEVIKAILKKHGVVVPLVGVSLAALFLLFLPARLLETLFGVPKFIEVIGITRKLIVFCLIISVSMLCAICLCSFRVQKVLDRFLLRRERNKFKARKKQHLKCLPPDEQAIIDQYFTNKTESELLPLTPPVIRLEKKEIIYRQHGLMHSRDNKVPFGLNDVVREIIFTE
jgi:hypothetical protein